MTNELPRPENPCIRNTSDFNNVEWAITATQEAFLDAGYIKLPTVEEIKQKLWSCRNEVKTTHVIAQELHDWLKGER